MADATFRREFLEAHNAHRAKHNSQMMTLSSELSASAQTWADYLLTIKTMKHSTTGNGENIFYQWSSGPVKLTGREAVDNWYDEINLYNWRSPGFSKGTGHFTQVVWSNSTKLGLGVASDGNRVFVVGQYQPAGNINSREEFENNVQRP
ncbi:Golgi-associated plant pathogenesis-related protein 1-like, partial [Brachionichthys hirsutus]